MIGRLHDLGPDQVGGKGSGLQRLIELGFPVPDALVVPVDAGGAVSPDDLELIRELGEPLAVRSSAVGEDAPNRSSAGQFASVMGVRLADVNDDFTGRAPDLGAYESERPVPVYGPRGQVRRASWPVHAP